MTILITGCAGFIGHHLSKVLLSQGYNVIGVDNFDPFYNKQYKLYNISPLLQDTHFTFYELDVCNLTQLLNVAKKHSIKAVIHLAAKAGVRPSVKAPFDYIETNINGSQNILELLKELQISKYIFASSSSIYGETKEVPFKETSCCNTPISPYSYTKKAGELMNYTYHKLYKIDVLNLRFFTAYGPAQRPDLAIHKFVHRIINNQPIELFGDGSTSRDYTYVSDIVNGIISALHFLFENNSVFESFNIGNHYPIKLSELIQTIEDVLNKQADIIYKPIQKGEVSITYADISKAKKLLNYNPKISLKEGINEFVKWYKAYYG